MTKTEVLALFDKWNNALASGDPQQVAKLYASDGILLPTVSNKVRHNHDEIADYFTHFLKKNPLGVINEANIREFGEVIVNSGIYTFTFADKTSVQARFTFVYHEVDGEWLIIEHHSSQMPKVLSG